MRRWAVPISLFLFVCLSLSAQTIDIKGAKESETPAYRPILLGTGPNALINRIDTGALIQKGQKDGIIMFSCMINKLGKMVETATYRGSPNSDALEQEVKSKLADAVFVPAIYNHLPVDAVYYGTATVVVVEGKPRLRIFSNQE